jgi:hypothetical protein
MQPGCHFERLDLVAAFPQEIDGECLKHELDVKGSSSTYLRTQSNENTTIRSIPSHFKLFEKKEPVSRERFLGPRK